MTGTGSSCHFRLIWSVSISIGSTLESPTPSLIRFAGRWNGRERRERSNVSPRQTAIQQVPISFETEHGPHLIEGTGNMQTSDSQQVNLFDDLKAADRSYGSAVFNKDKFIGMLEDICIVSDINSLKNKILHVRSVVESPNTDVVGIFDTESNGETVTMRKDVLTAELNQILEAQTADRAKYYLKRLQKGVQHCCPRTVRFSEKGYEKTLQ